VSATQRRRATEAEAKAVASAIRLRILRVCLDEPLTNQEIAGRLGANPATTLYHVRRLVDTGFLAPQTERRGTRGAREIPYLATGKSWTLDFRNSRADGQAMIDAFLQEMALVENPGEIPISRLALRLTQAEHAELVRRMTALFDELAERHRQNPDPGARPYSLFFAMHPDTSRG
jgi:predicted ArsR family transcriptional regulator